MTTNKRLTKILFVSLLLATAIMPVVIAQNSNFSKKIKLFSDECTFGEIELPEDFVVYAAKKYAGDKLSYTIDQSDRAATLINLRVNSPSEPAVLVLRAHEPSIWEIHWTEDTDIVAVVAMSGSRQAVAGLPKETPIIIPNSENIAKCPSLESVLKEVRDIEEFSLKLFNRGVKAAAEEEIGYLLLGEPIEEDAELLSSQDTPVESFFDYTAPRAGVAGIQDALEQGLIRRITQADIKAWDRLRKEQGTEEEVPPISEYYSEVYVVLDDDFTYPAGLTGNTPNTFVIPKGVAKPSGYNQSIVEYDFNTGKCRNTLCVTNFETWQ